MPCLSRCTASLKPGRDPFKGLYAKNAIPIWQANLLCVLHPLAMWITLLPSKRWLDRIPSANLDGSMKALCMNISVYVHVYTHRYTNVHVYILYLCVYVYRKRGYSGFPDSCRDLD